MSSWLRPLAANEVLSAEIEKLRDELAALKTLLVAESSTTSKPTSSGIRSGSGAASPARRRKWRCDSASRRSARRWRR